MPKATAAQRLQFNQLVLGLEPGVRDAFVAMVADLNNGVDWKRLLSALKKGDVDGAVAAMNIEAAVFFGLAGAMETAYVAGGALAANTISGPGGARLLFRFNMANPVAQAWISENAGQQIVGRMTRETLDLVRKTIVEGYARGENPLNIATDLAGRAVGPGAWPKRVGGVITLDGPRAARLQAVTVGMRTPAGVQGLVIAHTDGTFSVRYKVNKATEMRILSAYHKGQAVPEAQRLVSETQYYNQLLKARGDTIARTETGQAVMSGRFEAWRQAAEDKGYDVNDIVKTWRHGSSSKHRRPDHVAMNGKSVRGLYAPFAFQDGVLKQHALDGEGGGAHDINCGCGTDFRLVRRVS